jgi:putative spermidine/putrescine transport system substrate-binding protein
MVSWGGAYTRSQIRGFVRTYEKETGVDVDMLDYNGGIDEIRSQVHSWNVKWDVVDMELFDAIEACDEGLLEKIDPATLPPAPDGTPATEDFLEGALMPCGVGNVAFSMVIAYDRKNVRRPPTSVADYFNVKDFPGRRGMRRTPQTNLEWALIADGVQTDDVYKVLDTREGLERAFEVLTHLKPYIEWWQLGEEAMRLMETGRVVMTTAFNGRVSDAIERGQPFDIVWDHHVGSIDVLAVPKHGEHTDVALDFVRYATSTRSLAAQAKYIAYGPLRRSSLALLSPEIRDNLPTSPQNLTTMFESDPAWWAEHLQELWPRFERWAERPVMVPKEWPAR